jgi:guanylate kinase
MGFHFEPGALLLMVSGPAGSGKTTLCERLTGAFPGSIRRVITCTTRAPRRGEVDGVDYHFLDEGEFHARVGRGEFLEYAVVHGRCYGTRWADVWKGLDEGRDLLLNLDVQGADAVRLAAGRDARLGRALASVFIMPPSLEVLRQRLAGRGTDSVEEVTRRLGVAKVEMESWRRYDYCLVSGDREGDFERIRAVYLAEKMRVGAVRSAMRGGAQ